MGYLWPIGVALSPHGYLRQRQMALERSLGVKATAYAEHEDGATELGSPRIYATRPYGALWYPVLS